MASVKSSSAFEPWAGSHPIGWLDRDAQYGNVLATAQRFLKIKRIVDEAIPAPMRGAFNVIKVEATVLTLTVSSAAFAAKFRQLAPSVARQLKQQGWGFEEIKLKVHGEVDLQVPPKPPREARLLQAEDLACFDELLGQLPEGPLADAVARLIKRHRGA